MQVPINEETYVALGSLREIAVVSKRKAVTWNDVISTLIDMASESKESREAYVKKIMTTPGKVRSVGSIKKQEEKENEEIQPIDFKRL